VEVSTLPGLETRFVVAKCGKRPGYFTFYQDVPQVDSKVPNTIALKIQTDRPDIC